ncbi:conserved hypothetical protein TIGR00150 [gamma proteobacterium HTCC5015]|nr:conserved hypothetical protein TIGR00150 [gamma proteobacterium HTCC5015]
MASVRVYAADEAAMIAWGQRLARVVSSPAVVYLRGDLGAGKTTLSRAWIRALGHEGAVKSPTYTLVEPYEFGESGQGGFSLYHFDLYRLGDPEELEAIGLRDYLSESAICLFEWPERGEGILPEADWEIVIEPQDVGRGLSIYTQDDVALSHL